MASRKQIASRLNICRIPSPLLHLAESRYIARTMPRAPLPLTTTEGRRIWLRAQRLDTAAPFGDGAQAVADAVEQLGYVQIDTINVIERATTIFSLAGSPLSPRRFAAGPERRQKRVRILDPCAVLRAVEGFPLLHPGDEAHKREGHRWFAPSARRTPKSDAAARATAR